ncbi:MAG: CtsR family transcriptional regulator [Eubacteriales bacterium]|nr:CtsR family transcriptional regulator [Eubacteriales bacterium]
MELISDLIEAKILQLLDEAEGLARFSRRDLADEVGCAPSQVSYVLQTRFRESPNFTVYSRRGLGGFVVVERRGESQALAKVIAEMPETLAETEAEQLFSALDILDKNLLQLMRAVSCELASPETRFRQHELRAQLIGAMLKAILGDAPNMKED